MRTYTAIEARAAEGEVKRNYPTAFVLNEAEGLLVIKEKRQLSDTCRHCGQTWVREEVSLWQLGHGSSEDEAWLDAFDRMQERAGQPAVPLPTH